MKILKLILGVLVSAIITTSCQNEALDDTNMFSFANHSNSVMTRSASTSTLPFFKGADLSYINELEDVGVSYYDADGDTIDPYTIVNDYGANMIRLRLWHNPTWTTYSTLNDVKKSFARAKALGMHVLLDFHYSDTWTDPEQNLVPAAWASVVNDSIILADSVYNYTYATLSNLRNSGYIPTAVQIGNETNYNIMVSDNSLLRPINYARNVVLFNAGLRAVADFNEQYDESIQTVLHVAMDPGNAMTWVTNLKQYGISNFDMLGLSYYPQWQGYTPAELGSFTATLLSTYGIKLLVAETGHIWTRKWKDNSHNLMSKMAPGYPECPCPQLQKDFLIEVKDAVRNNGGAGVCAWEPLWVSADNVTLWGVGSNWENVTFFDFNNTLLEHGGMEFYSEDNVAVTFSVDMTNAESGTGAYITGEFTTNDDGEWQIFPMNQVGSSNVYEFTTHLSKGQSGAYYYLNDTVWTAKETIPESCQLKWGDRLYQTTTTSTTQTISNTWSGE